jgi:glutamine amidotransferase
MKKKIVGLIDTGTSNIKSVFYALKLFNTEIISIDSNSDKKIDCMVVPGIGSFKTVMEKLKKQKLDQFIKKQISLDIPSLFICVGMQILFTKSYEFGETKGLNILKGDVLKIPNLFQKKKLNVPFIGWNKLDYKKKCSVFDKINKDNFFYFTHSYYVKPENEKIISTCANYSGFEYCSSISHNKIYASQFHPEKSGNAGLKIYKNFLNQK